MKLPMDVSVSYTAIPTQHYEAMKAIIAELATTKATFYNDTDGETECPFCSGWRDHHVKTVDEFKHEDDCIIMKARMLVSEWEKKP